MIGGQSTEAVLSGTSLWSRIFISATKILGIKCSINLLSPAVFLVSVFLRSTSTTPGIRFDTVQQEYGAAPALRDIRWNLKYSTLTLQMATPTVEYLPMSHILQTFADKVRDLTCLAIYENFDYV